MAGSNNQDSVIIRNVWTHNLEDEIKSIRDIVDKFNHIGIDSEYPGVVKTDRMGMHLDPKTMNSEQIYQSMKSNVDVLKPVQLGLTFTDRVGNLAHGTVWQFNFKDFDQGVAPHSSESIDFLRNSGIDLEKNKEKGIVSTKFAELLMSSGVVSNDNMNWVTFHGLYDIGFLLKLLSGTNLPATKDEFLNKMKVYFPVVYDVKHLIKSCRRLHGGLSKLGELLKVKRIGTEHQAGSDSLHTCNVFNKLIDEYFNGVLPKEKSGLLHGLVDTF